MWLPALPDLNLNLIFSEWSLSKSKFCSVFNPSIDALKTYLLSEAKKETLRAAVGI